jgi:hypothetical protein
VVIILMVVTKSLACMEMAVVIAGKAWAVAVMALALVVMVCAFGVLVLVLAVMAWEFAVQELGLVVMAWFFCSAGFCACGEGLSGWGDGCEAYNENLGFGSDDMVLVVKVLA